jgi:hypothetical protein
MNILLTEVDHDEAVVGDELVYLLPVEVLYDVLVGLELLLHPAADRLLVHQVV